MYILLALLLLLLLLCIIVCIYIYISFNYICFYIYISYIQIIYIYIDVLCIPYPFQKVDGFNTAVPMSAHHLSSAAGHVLPSLEGSNPPSAANRSSTCSMAIGG